MIGQKIQAFFSKQTTPKADKDPWEQKYEALAKAYKKAGYTRNLPQLGDVKYLAACRKLGLDPVFAVPPPGYNPDLCFVKHQPPLHLTREQIFAQPKNYIASIAPPRSYSSSSKSSGSSGSRVSFADKVEIVPRKSVPRHAVLQPLRSALKSRRPG